MTLLDILQIKPTLYGSIMVKGSQKIGSFRPTYNENSTELRSIISDSFTTVIRLGDFKASIIDAFSHKVSRAIISNNDGLFDKVSNELKQDAICESKMSIAVANVVEECLTQRK